MLSFRHVSVVLSATIYSFFGISFLSFSFLSLSLFGISTPAIGSEPLTTVNHVASSSPLTSHEKRIITLSPHLTELVFELGQGDHLVAVSEYSDYPKQAGMLPTVASYQGANIAEIVRLKPTHVLVWRGGNKDTDIARLHSLGLNIYESVITNTEDLLNNINAIAEFLDAQQGVTALFDDISNVITNTNRIDHKSLSVVYVLNQLPIIGLGNDKWLNQLLRQCKLQNIFDDTVSAFPQLRIDEIMRHQPRWIINATGTDNETFKAAWQQHLGFMASKVISIDPDAMHRFSVRAIYETFSLCKRIHD